MQTDEKEQKRNILNSKTRDSGSKFILEDPVLCAQFLRGFIPLDILKDIRPEDIEDVSERYVPLISEERNSDIVKKVHIPDKENDKKNDKIPLFLISLIEHKTEVDYNVFMQIFRYMVYIWEDYEKEMEKKNPGCSSLKGFKYPPIIPIVYYEGKPAWTAAAEFKDRVLGSEIFGRYTPNFTYHLVRLHDYSSESLLENGEEIALVMLINKIQSSADIEEFRQLPQEKIESILQNTPDYLLEKIAVLFRTFLTKLNVSEDETEEIVGMVKERKMGEMWANMEKMDIQEERRRTAEARRELDEMRSFLRTFLTKLNVSEDETEEIVGMVKERKMGEMWANIEKMDIQEERRKTDETRRELDDIKKDAEELKQKLEEADQKAAQTILDLCREMDITKEAAIEKLLSGCNLSRTEAEEMAERYWQ